LVYPSQLLLCYHEHSLRVSYFQLNQLISEMLVANLNLIHPHTRHRCILGLRSRQDGSAQTLLTIHRQKYGSNKQTSLSPKQIS
jgi:hypothetical protein